MVKNKIGTPAIYTFDNLIGESKEFKQAITIGQRFAKSAENILLCGESGTGKELFAQAIHNSYRPWGPFIAVNCAAVPKNLIESELFGYEAGSFTGADRGGKVGKIELANGGTLFLDEIGDMPLEIQAVLLRVLEDKQVMRIGGQCNHKVDFKVIAATNKNLFKLMKEILFREDLYFRLSVLSINLPSLRERGKDKEILSNYFVKKYCAKLGREAMQISPAALKKINDYDWPGNIRQLENAMIYAVQISSGEVIKLEDLPEYILLDNPEQFEEAINPEKRPLSFKESEKLLIENAIVKAKYDVAVAATMLNISKSTVYRKLKEYNIEY
jgi:PAS modulated sigma54 specific transcriptional regulator, Fis family